MENYTIYNFKNYQFICHTWQRGQSWGHEVHLIENGFDIAQARVRYINRTWEKYAYQSTMYEAVHNRMKFEVEQKTDNYRYANEVDRLPKGKKAEFEAEVEAKYDELLKFIEKGEK